MVSKDGVNICFVMHDFGLWMLPLGVSGRSLGDPKCNLMLLGGSPRFPRREPRMYTMYTQEYIDI